MIEFQPDCEIQITRVSALKKTVAAMFCPVVGFEEYEFFITESIGFPSGFEVTEKTTGRACIACKFLTGAHNLSVEDAYYLACFTLFSVGKEGFEIAIKKALNEQI
jgi:hypothetical protein